MKEIAIIGPTASGKSDLALRLAMDCNAFILSIDSLSIYKEIDIASAKPGADELSKVRHFGINLLLPDEHFSVSTFTECYREAKHAAEREGKNLIIVGGTGFYLKSLLTGLSPLPGFSSNTRRKAAELLRDLPGAYALLHDADAKYMQHIEPTDAYRIEKMLLLYLESGQTPTQWFSAHPAKPVINDLPLFEIDVQRSILRERIGRRTKAMVGMGLINEVAALESRYGRTPNAMKAIGIIEVLEYLDGTVTKEEMVENIITHTSQLAKRQQTFNRNQFAQRVLLSPEEICIQAAKILQQE